MEYWPIPATFRTMLISRTTHIVYTEKSPRHVIAGCRILFTASRLNLRHRLLPRQEVPRINPNLPPLPTKREYEAWLRSDEDYLAYRHDWRVHKAGYPPGHELKWLPFPIYPGITPASMPDRSRRLQLPGPPEREQYTWEEFDLWHIPSEHRPGIMACLARYISSPPDVGIALSASRCMLFASSVNLQYQKLPDLKPPYKPWKPFADHERYYNIHQFCDSQWSLYHQDRMLYGDGYPKGETFRWLTSPPDIYDELVNWDRVNAALIHDGVELDENGEPRQ